MNRLVEWSPCDCSQFVSSTSNRLELHRIIEKYSELQIANSLKVTRTIIHQAVFEFTGTINCLNWYPNDSNINENAIVVGLSDGSISLVKSDSKSDTFNSIVSVYDQSSGKKPCTALSFNKVNKNLLAAGFEKKSGGKGDFCFAVFDIEHKNGDSIEFKSITEEPIASVSWLPNDPHIVAVGTSLSYVKFYDIRMKSSSDVQSISAHPATRPRKVKGIKPDPFNSHTIATFSDSAGEHIKLWDLRKSGSVKPKFTIIPLSNDIETTNVSTQSVVDISWSPTRSNVIAVATSHQKAIQFYNTVKSLPEVFTKVPYHTIPSSDQVKSISWQNIDEANNKSNRLLVATVSGVDDIEVVEETALAIGMGNHVIVNYGKKLFTGITNIPPGFNDELFIKNRVAAGYSLDSGKNLQVLADEIEYYKNDNNKALPLYKLKELYRTWEWIERVETLNENNINLSSCGVLQLVQDNIKDNAAVSVLPKIGVEYFISNQRTLARTICGWADCLDDETINRSNHAERLSSIEDIVEDYESSDSFERASTLALWHGNINLAVKILKRNTDTSSSFTEDEEIKKKEKNLKYSHLISLVAMCIAGFFPSNDSANLPTRSSWISMCTMVIDQLESYEDKSNYLIASCKFMLQCSESKSDNYKDILDDHLIAMEDRIAFACTYLGNERLIEWLVNVKNNCVYNGCLEGLLVTSITGEGVAILQCYIDLFNDIQTVALIVGRNIDANAQDNQLASTEWYWLQEYRSILNRWELYIDRAMLDVELGKRHRYNNYQLLSRTPKAAVSSGKTSVTSKTTSIDRKSGASRVQYTLPIHCDTPHIFLRCHYCSSSLPVDAMNQQQRGEFLRKQKPILNCCPNCKKPLPRCYVCQLYMGLVNPHLEFNRIMNQKRDMVDNSKEKIDSFESKQEHNVLEFGSWFFFCQRCKHGGHAACIDAWFEGDKSNGRSICGVNGCDCNCNTI